SLLFFTTLLSFFFILPTPPPTSSLFPYTTLFRSSSLTRCPAMSPGWFSFPQDAWSKGMPAATAAFTFTEALKAQKSTGSSNEPKDRKSTRLNSSHVSISYAVFCLKKKKTKKKLARIIEIQHWTVRLVNDPRYSD